MVIGDAGIPSQVVVGIDEHGAELVAGDEAGGEDQVGSLADDDLAERDSLAGNVADRLGAGAGEEVGIGVGTVVVLDVVEVDEAADALVDLDVGLLRVVGVALLEEPGLDSVDDDVVGQPAAELVHEGGHPVLARPEVEGVFVVPVHVHPVEVVGLHEVGQLVRAVQRSVVQGCGHLVAKGRDQHFDSVVVVELPEVCLHFGGGGAEGTAGEVGVGVGPDVGDVDGPLAVGPGLDGHVVVVMGGVGGHRQGTRQRSVGGDGCKMVDDGHSYRV